MIVDFSAPIPYPDCLDHLSLDNAEALVDSLSGFSPYLSSLTLGVALDAIIRWRGGIASSSELRAILVDLLEVCS